MPQHDTNRADTLSGAHPPARRIARAFASTLALVILYHFENTMSTQPNTDRRADATLAAALDQLDALHRLSDDEVTVTRLISAARDGVIACYQQGLDLDAARIACDAMARAMMANYKQGIP